MTNEANIDVAAVAHETSTGTAPEIAAKIAETLPEIYQDYRTARLNVMYYGYRLRRVQNINLAIEIAIALGTSGTVASLAIWHTTAGKVLFGVLVGIATVLSVTKPVLNLSRRIERLSKLWSGWTLAYSNLNRVVVDVRRRHVLRSDMERLYEATRERSDQLDGDDDLVPNRKLQTRLEAAVNDEIPPDRLWVPATS